MEILIEGDLLRVLVSLYERVEMVPYRCIQSDSSRKGGRGEMV